MKVLFRQNIRAKAHVVKNKLILFTSLKTWLMLKRKAWNKKRYESFQVRDVGLVENEKQLWEYLSVDIYNMRQKDWKQQQ